MYSLSKTFGLFFVLLAIFLFVRPAEAQYGGGSGELNDPYLIYTAEQMNTIGAEPNDWDKHFRLMADIDLAGFTGTDFNIIGYWVDWGSPDNKPFTGVFDGSAHIISNFNYTSTDRNYVGLFGYAFGAQIKDLGLIDPDIDAGTGDSVGSLVGYIYSGTITNCYAEGGSVLGNKSVGGLMGTNLSGTITNCSSTGSVFGTGTPWWYGGVGGLVGENRGTITNCTASGRVSGNWNVGGLVAHNCYGTITNCYSTGSVSGYNNVGGLVGLNSSYGTITNCYATGSVTGTRSVGGLVGLNYDTITNCYSSGDVSGTNNVGGLVGSGGAATNSFWDIQTSGQTTSAGGTGKTTSEMQTMSTFTDGGWDFVGKTDDGISEIWQMPEGGGYPVLAIFNGYTPPQLQGMGTREDPYLISNALELGAMVHYSPYAHYRLDTSIDLAGIRWGTAVIPWFAGTFDGNGLTISHLTVKGGGYLGLFGQLESGTEVKDLGVVDVNITGSEDYVGGLVGINEGYVTDCYSTGTVSGHRWYVGGLVGDNSYRGTITNCYATGGVFGNEKVGGLVGYNYGTITNCYATGSVSGGKDIGGLVGTYSPGMYPYAIITNCYSTGSVSGEDNVGGLVGYNGSYSEFSSGGMISNCYSSGDVSGGSRVGGLVGSNSWGGTITNCYSSGDVSGGSRVGGLVGRNGEYGTITNCYSIGGVTGTTNIGGLIGSKSKFGTPTVTDSFWDIQTSGQTTSAGGMGKTTAEMQTESTFTDAGWDFVAESANGTEDIW